MKINRKGSGITPRVNHISRNMGNRSRTEIVGSILDAANEGTTKTKIIYFAFLRYNQLN
jgi:predicted transcriptional regulator